MRINRGPTQSLVYILGAVILAVTLSACPTQGRFGNAIFRERHPQPVAIPILSGDNVRPMAAGGTVLLSVSRLNGDEVELVEVLSSDPTVMSISSVEGDRVVVESHAIGRADLYVRARDWDDVVEIQVREVADVHTIVLGYGADTFSAGMLLGNGQVIDIHSVALVAGGSVELAIAPVDQFGNTLAGFDRFPLETTTPGAHLQYVPETGVYRLTAPDEQTTVTMVHDWGTLELEVVAQNEIEPRLTGATQQGPLGSEAVLQDGMHTLGVHFAVAQFTHDRRFVVGVTPGPTPSIAIVDGQVTPCGPTELVAELLGVEAWETLLADHHIACIDLPPDSTNILEITYGDATHVVELTIPEASSD